MMRISRGFNAVALLLLAALYVCGVAAQGSSQKAVPAPHGSAAKPNVTAGKPSVTSTKQNTTAAKPNTSAANISTNAVKSSGARIDAKTTEGAKAEAPEAAYQVLVFSNSGPADSKNAPKAVELLKQALADYLFRAESVDQVNLYSVDFGQPKAKAVFEVSGPTARGGAADVLTNCKNYYILLFDETLSANVAKGINKAIELLWPGQKVTVSKAGTPECTATPGTV